VPSERPTSAQIGHVRPGRVCFSLPLASSPLVAALFGVDGAKTGKSKCVISSADTCPLLCRARRLEGGPKKRAKGGRTRAGSPPFRRRPFRVHLQPDGSQPVRRGDNLFAARPDDCLRMSARKCAQKETLLVDPFMIRPTRSQRGDSCWRRSMQRRGAPQLARPAE